MDAGFGLHEPRFHLHSRSAGAGSRIGKKVQIQHAASTIYCCPSLSRNVTLGRPLTCATGRGSSGKIGIPLVNLLDRHVNRRRNWAGWVVDRTPFDEFPTSFDWENQ